MSTGRVSGVDTSLLPRPSTPPVFDHLQYAKTAEKAPGILAHDRRHDHHMSSCLTSTVKVIYETDLAFCVSYKDGPSGIYPG